jgi:hypothetical protein
MRVLSIYSRACEVSPRVWSQLQSAKIDGIRCDGADIPLPYWVLLPTAISGSSISHFRLNLGFLSLMDEDMPDFESVMHILSHTVRVASFNVVAGSDIYQRAFQIIQQSFKKLISLELTDLASWNRSWVLQQNWSCIGELQTLCIRSSRVPFWLLTDFIEYSSEVINLTIQDCVPEDTSNEGVAFIGLEENRNFNYLDIPDRYGDGLYTGPIEIFRYSGSLI